MRRLYSEKQAVWLLHITICVLLLAIPAIDPPLDPIGKVEVPLLLKDMLQSVLLLCFFYANYLFLIPVLYFGKRYFLFTVLIVVAYFFVTSVPDLLFFRMPPPPPGFEEGHHNPREGTIFIGKHAIHNLLTFAISFFISSLLWVNKAYAKERTDRAKLELGYLKTQINPHFLFNTLTALFALASKGSRDTAPGIQSLSNMMRYVLHNESNDMIPLEEEIQYLTDYIQLQKHRYKHTLEVSYLISGNVENKRIAPFLILPFIENAFKYGVSPEEPSKISIEINTYDNQLDVYIANNKVDAHEGTIESFGIGIKNTKARLQMIYPENHELHINDQDNIYTVKLTLNLT